MFQAICVFLLTTCTMLQFRTKNVNSLSWAQDARSLGRVSGYLLLIVKQIYKVFNMAESSSSIREPFFCRHMNGADEVLLAIPSDAASKLWGNDKAPKNVLIQSQDGRKFNVSLSEAKGKHFFFYGWSNVVKHLQLKKGCLVLFNPVDFSTFKVTHFIDGVFQSSFWTSMLSTTSNFIVIPESVLPNFYDYMSGDIISIIDVGNKIFHVKIETLFGKVGFSIGIDVIVNLFQLEDGCYLIFTRGFGNYFHLTILEKNGVEINYADVQVDEPVVAPIDAIEEPNIDEQQNERVYKFVRMASKDFRLPDNVSRMAKLDSDLKPMTIRLLHLTEQEEFTNHTRREKRGESWPYALCKWSRFMKRARINERDTVHFSFDETHQVLNVELVVPYKKKEY
ncbi:putative transcription factor B3-Domain family [Helianthus annuus]|uniref:Transcription factor B3-Domain family n=1 Tax=Helianthus annuus TaxID=4232 RepID=A0A9K3E1L1_HELAN|nr:putative transcription factor B3-Domain family [Helianthus annuus]